MPRKLVIAGLAVLLAVAAAGGLVLWSLRQAPEYYQSALAGPSSVERKQEAKRFVQTTLQLVDEIRYEPLWSEEFTEDEVNAWLAEELHQKYPDWLPPGVAQPRVRFSEGVLSLAFQFERGRWGGVVSVEVRPWVPEPNRLALEIRSARVGLVPIPLDTFSEDLSDAFEKLGWRIQWKQSQGHDVLVVDLQGAEDRRPLLQAVSVESARLRIAGSRQTSVVQENPDESRHIQ